MIKYYCDKCKKEIKNSVYSMKVTVMMGEIYRTTPEIEYVLCTFCMQEIKKWSKE